MPLLAYGRATARDVRILPRYGSACLSHSDLSHGSFAGIPAHPHAAFNAGQHYVPIVAHVPTPTVPTALDFSLCPLPHCVPALYGHHAVPLILLPLLCWVEPLYA